MWWDKYVSEIMEELDIMVKAVLVVVLELERAVQLNIIEALQTCYTCL